MRGRIAFEADSGCNDKVWRFRKITFIYVLDLRLVAASLACEPLDTNSALGLSNAAARVLGKMRGTG